MALMLRSLSSCDPRIEVEREGVGIRGGSRLSAGGGTDTLNRERLKKESGEKKKEQQKEEAGRYLVKLSTATSGRPTLFLGSTHFSFKLSRETKPDPGTAKRREKCEHGSWKRETD